MAKAKKGAVANHLGEGLSGLLPSPRSRKKREAAESPAQVAAEPSEPSPAGTETPRISYAAARDHDRGVRCPECGCRHSEVLETRPTFDQRTRRQRACRNCGREFTTYERVPGA